MENARTIIERAWESRAHLTATSAPADVRSAVEQALQGLDSGRLRVAEKTSAGWVTHQWLKMAVLLSFRIDENRLVEGASTRYYDKVPGKFDASGSCRPRWCDAAPTSPGTSSSCPPT